MARGIGAFLGVLAIIVALAQIFALFGLLDALGGTP
jgi:hypothetical protein